MYMKARKYILGRPILQLPGIMRGVMGALLQYYYKQYFYHIKSVIKLYYIFIVTVIFQST